MRKSKLALETLPYVDTIVPVLQTKEEIIKLLRESGAEGVQWGEIWRPFRMVRLEFVRKCILYRMEIPMHTEDIEKQKELIAPYKLNEYMAQREKAMYRAIFHHLQGQFKSEKHGLMKFEQAFIGFRVVNLPSGEQTTVGDAILRLGLEPGRALPAPGEPLKGEVMR